MDRFFKDLFLRTLMNIVNNFKKIVVILKFSVRNGEATEINLMALTNKKGEEIFFFGVWDDKTDFLIASRLFCERNFF